MFSHKVMDMGFVDFISNLLSGDNADSRNHRNDTAPGIDNVLGGLEEGGLPNQPLAAPTSHYPQFSVARSVESSAPSPWFEPNQAIRMPAFEGRYICDWVNPIAQLKRDGDLDTALYFAKGCMEEMVRAARENPANVMEFYVSQVLIIQHKQRDYVGELETLDYWLGLQLPASRQDLHVNLLKRQAKAQEMAAKRSGTDPAPYTAEWKRLVELEKETKKSQVDSGSLTGRSAAGLDSIATVSRHAPRRYAASPEALAKPKFVAVDFETANRSSRSACQIAMVKVEYGQIVDRFSTLLKPPPGHDEFEFTYLHGISARDVADAPSWKFVEPYLRAFVDRLPVYAHNASFDRGVWVSLDSYYGTRTLPEEFYCSYRTAKRLIPGLENYKLPTVTKAIAPWFRLDHHRADSDAEACALIVIGLQMLENYSEDERPKQ